MSCTEHHNDAPVPAPQSWQRVDALPCDASFSRAPAPAEACSDFGFENEPAPRRARLGSVHGLERWFLHHPTATTVAVLVLVGLAYLGAKQ